MRGRRGVRLVAWSCQEFEFRVGTTQAGGVRTWSVKTSTSADVPLVARDVQSVGAENWNLTGSAVDPLSQNFKFRRVTRESCCVVGSHADLPRH